MTKELLRKLGIGWLLLVCIVPVWSQQLSVSYIKVPTDLVEGTDLEVRGAVAVRGINDAGSYVGMIGQRDWTIWGVPHGFIHTSASNLPLGVGSGETRWGPQGFRLGEITGTRYAPDPFSTERFHYFDLAPEPYPSTFNYAVSAPNAINNAGLVVGSISDGFLATGSPRAFVFDSRIGSLTLLDIPNAVSSVATDINAAGQIVGDFIDSSGGSHGFLLTGNSLTVIDMPGELGRTRIGGINDSGVIVGSANDVGNPSSFIWRNGLFDTFTANNAYTVAADINENEQIVGWVGVSGTRRGFVYQGGVSTIYDATLNDGGSTYFYTINNAGVMGGMIDGGGTSQAFLATVVPEPGSSALLALGLVALSSCFRRQAKAALLA